MKTTIKSAKILSIVKNVFNINTPLSGDWKSKIIYEDRIYLCSLTLDELNVIVLIKKEIMNKVVFNGDRFAMRNQLTEDEFDFVKLCDSKRIGRNATFLN